MTARIRPLLILIGALLLLTQTALCAAQDKGHEGWYQIEVVVFTRPEDKSPEVWPKDITLKYPANWEQLHDPDASDASVDLADTPYYFLPAKDRELNSVSARLDERRQYRVLFHEAWRQIVVAKDRAPSVLIFGGDSFGKHHELEGSLQISVSRYLHVTTNLWLTRFHVNTGQSRNQWPALPQSPIARLAQLQQTKSDDTPLFSAAAANPQSPDHNSLQHWDSQALSAPGDNSPDFLSAPYLPEQIITLKQHRKMRSNELHYIDHPRMGLLIKIQHYQPPETQEQTGGQ